MLVEQLRGIDNQKPILVKKGAEIITWSRFSDSSEIPRDVIRIRNPQQQIFSDTAPELLVIAVQDRTEVIGASMQVFTEMIITGSNIAGPTHTRTTPVLEQSPTPTELFKVAIRFNDKNMQSATVKLSDSTATFVHSNGEFITEDKHIDKSKFLGVLTACINAATYYILAVSPKK